MSFNKDHVVSSRVDDDANVLALPANYLSEIETLQIAELFLTTEFSNEERHLRRIQKVSEIDPC